MSSVSGARVVLFGMVFLWVSLSGCIQDDGQGDPEDEAQPRHGDGPLPPEEIAGLEPGWFPGLVYTYHVEHPPTGSQAVIDFVVLDGPGTDWTLDPVDEEEDQQEVLAWALYWGLPVGAVDFQEYEPRRDGEPMDWFSFPIEESKRWEGTAPDGHEVTFQAQAVDLELPGGKTTQGYRVTGERDGARILEYEYTSEVGWFVSLWWDATGDGEAEVELDLRAVEVEPTLAHRPLRSLERFVDLRVQEAELEDLEVVPGWPLVVEGFDVPSPGNVTWWLSRYTQGTGAYQANVSFEGGPGWESSGIPQAPEDRYAWGRLTPEAAGGEARVALLGEGEVHLVGLQLAPRPE